MHNWPVLANIWLSIDKSVLMLGGIVSVIIQEQQDIFNDTECN